MFDFLNDLLTDPKKSAPFAAAVSTVLVQLAASRGWAVDAHAADAISFGLLSIAGVVAASHAHVEHGQIRADGDVTAAKVSSPAPPRVSAS